MTSKAGTSHIGSMLSIADIIAVLFNDILQTKPFKKIKIILCAKDMQEELFMLH